MSKLNIDDAIYVLLDRLPFLGHMVQSLSSTVTKAVPTAGIMYDVKTRRYQMYVNPDFFGKLSIKERVALIEHEMYHILYKHTSYKKPANSNDMMRLNIAMDLVINQRIDNLPEGAMFIKNFKDKDGNLFPEDKPLELYYNLLTPDAETKTNQQGQGEPSEGEGQGSGEGSGEGSGDGKKWTKLKDLMKARKEDGAFDTHGWNEGNISEEEHLQATQELIKRTMEKSSIEHNKLPGFVREALEEIERRLKKLNCKELLLRTLRKSAPNVCRAKTWHKPNKNYGKFAKGTRTGKYPSLYFLIDTSGSISIKEANEFLSVTNQFMTAGVTKAKIGLFHTSLYKVFPKVKKRFKLNYADIQSGGTDLTRALKEIIKEQPDLLVILTDGYFSLPNVDLDKMPELVTVLTQEGDMKHPLGKYGKTIKYTFKD